MSEQARMSEQPAAVEVLGIRHHGPGSARSVLAALDELRPRVVAIELPEDCGELLAWVADDELVPPVALVATASPDRSVAFPMCEFSPEWQTLRWAARHCIPVVPIDLAAGEMLTVPPEERTPAGGSAADPIGELALAAGYPDAERWWDDVVEHRGDGLATMRAVAEAMGAVRAGLDTPAYGARREANMRDHLARLRAATDGPVVAVCGAWHVPALVAPAADAAPRRPSARTPHRSARRPAVAWSWVPWTHDRLPVASAGWYAHLFHHPGADGVQRWFVDVVRTARELGSDVSPEDVIAATRTAYAIAALRDRPVPGLEEVSDAATAALPPSARAALATRLAGAAVGAVPSDAPQVPLAVDVAAQARRLRLARSGEVRTLELDLRRPNGRARSHLLHRLTILGIPWGAPLESRSSTGTFRETWALRWTPECSLAVVRAAVHGADVRSAATAAARDRVVRASDVVQLVSLLGVLLAAGLDEVVADALGALDRRGVDAGGSAAAGADTVSLADALVALAPIVRYGDVRDVDREIVGRITDRLVARVVAGLGQAAHSLDDDRAEEMSARLRAIHGALGVLEHRARGRAWPGALERLAHDRAVHPMVRGRAVRLLHDLTPATTAAPGETSVAAHLARATSVGVDVADAAGFVEGFFADSGALLVHDASLLELVDRWLCGLDADSFDRSLVALRRTFATFHDAERREIARRLAEGPDDGIGAGGDGTTPDDVSAGAGYDAALAAEAMATVRTMTGAR